MKQIKTKYWFKNYDLLRIISNFAFDNLKLLNEIFKHIIHNLKKEQTNDNYVNLKLC